MKFGNNRRSRRSGAMSGACTAPDASLRRQFRHLNPSHTDNVMTASGSTRTAADAFGVINNGYTPRRIFCRRVYLQRNGSLRANADTTTASRTSINMLVNRHGSRTETKSPRRTGGYAVTAFVAGLPRDTTRGTMLCRGNSCPLFFCKRQRHESPGGTERRAAVAVEAAIKPVREASRRRDS